jgi:DNA-binding PadR family transcriptional regulator
VYEITPEGLKYLEEHRDLLDEIVDRVRETVRDFTGGAVGELQGEFARLARTTFRHAWRRGPDDPTVRQVAEILKRAADDIERAWQASAEQSSTAR